MVVFGMCPMVGEVDGMIHFGILTGIQDGDGMQVGEETHGPGMVDGVGEVDGAMHGVHHTADSITDLFM